MVPTRMTSLKNQAELVRNPLDFSLDLSRGWELFSSYQELITDFNFGSYLWTSFYVSELTVVITLLFSIPGAYAIARLRFKGQSVMSRSILLIYMVPMIVLALPIYIAFSVTGNTPLYLAFMDQHEESLLKFQLIGYGMIALMAVILFRGFTAVFIVSLAPSLGVLIAARAIHVELYARR